MIFEGDNGIKLIFTVNDDSNKPVDLTDSTVEILLQNKEGMKDIPKICSKMPGEINKCFIILTSEDTLITGMWNYQLTIKTGSTTISSTIGKYTVHSKLEAIPQ